MVTLLILPPLGEDGDNGLEGDGGKSLSLSLKLCSEEEAGPPGESGDSLGVFRIPALCVSVCSSVCLSTFCPFIENGPGRRPSWFVDLTEIKPDEAEVGEEHGASGANATLMFGKLLLGLGDSMRDEVGVFKEDTEEKVLFWREDAGEEPKLIKARPPPTVGSGSGLEHGSEEALTAIKSLLKLDLAVGMTELDPGTGAGTVSIGVEVCSGPGSTLLSIFTDLSVGMGREVGAEAPVFVLS